MNTALLENNHIVTKQFLNDVLNGLSAEFKSLNPKYFYDEKGDLIFQQIMEMQEYYLTNAEMEIFSGQAESICSAIAQAGEAFDLIELGAGDATKSIHLLQTLSNKNYEFSYLPIDISSNVIAHLEEKLPLQIPNIDIKGYNGDYFEMLSLAKTYSSRRKVVLFMGANIGNMTIDDAKLFCQKLKNQLSPGDFLVIGFDLKKNPKQILAAYFDKNGITSAFNLNLLTRINNELNGNFDLTKFEHYAFYHPESGECKSYLISLIAQNVAIGDHIISFAANEYIYMEISQKYALHEIEELAKSTGFSILKTFTDQNKYFVDSIWKVN